MGKSPIRMSSRLHTVADMITPGMTVADIGTDHGYIPIYQVMTGRAEHAYACDVALGPLGRARDNVSLYHVEDRVKLVLSDGLDGFSGDEEELPECIVIAGMGGSLVCRILDSGRKIACHAKELVLSPHSEWYEVRSYLFENGFGIVDENMIKEDGKFYVIIKAVPIKAGECEDCLCFTRGAVMDKAELHFGPVLLNKKHPVLLEYLEKERDTCCKILYNLKQNAAASSAARWDEIMEWKNIIEEAINTITEV